MEPISPTKYTTIQGSQFHLGALVITTHGTGWHATSKASNAMHLVWLDMIYLPSFKKNTKENLLSSIL